jgi:AraC family transcriptional regulator
VRDQQRNSNTIADGLGLRPPRTLLVGSPSSRIEISRIVCGPETVGMTSVIPATEAFALGVYQTNIPYHEIWRRGHSVIRQGYAAQSMQLADLADEYAAKICGTHEVVAFSIPYSALDDVADDSHRRRVRGLRCDPGLTDPVVAHLVASLLPALEQPHQASALFLEYVTLALCVHLMRTYGALSPIRVPGGLSLLHLKRSKDLMANDLAEDLSLARVASECGLSREHFCRAFKITTGLTPHQWRQLCRIDAVKQLLAGRSRSIADIALSCGFADQSHLTRVFGRFVGTSPAQWRRDRPLH